MLRTLLLTGLALCAFAANSLLCRLALAPGGMPAGAHIDPVSFTSVRLASGALLLWLMLRARRPPVCASATAPATAAPWRRVVLPQRGRLLAALMLFTYAIGFSVAYTAMGAAPGALVLFGSVQLTMLCAGLAAGERPGAARWTGMALALAGLAWLLLPGLHAPPLPAALCMGVAGAAWGAYSLLGRHASDPLGATAANFLLATPLALLASLLLNEATHVDAAGLLLAAGSGAIASGLGYVIWYAALRGLAASSAATAQLAVPVLTAAAAVPLLGETIGLRLVLSGLLVLGGIALALRRPG